MLTFVEAISLAGDRAKQNDDACGFVDSCAWVIDGATDLHEEPLTRQASDAAWLAHRLNAALYCMRGANHQPGLREAIARAITEHLGPEASWYFKEDTPKWRHPIASLLMLYADDGDIYGIDLGDCRVFALGADGAVHVVGGPDDAADEESKSAALQTDAHKPLLDRHDTIAKLRDARASLNRPGARWTFCLDPACADHARTWSFKLTRPAHILLMTDGFSALTDRYRAYDAGGLVRAALSGGLQELGRELRAIENEDAGAAKHPRFKKSDDATALLMRLT
ncbi:MAG: protein phosphatase 2C domain-containing protein [Hyphomonadaceae bacterium]|nr:protein phosphatase 2C domain-containing protein [Hyphomonadaceae bacterium]